MLVAGVGAGVRSFFFTTGFFAAGFCAPLATPKLTEGDTIVKPSISDVVTRTFEIERGIRFPLVKLIKLF